MVPSLPAHVPLRSADQQRALDLGVHQVLQIVHLLAVGLDLRQSVLVGFMLVAKTGIDFGKIDLAARFDDELPGVFQGLVSCF